MAYTIQEVVEIIRNRLKLQPNDGPRLRTLVDSAVQALVEREGSHLDKRHYTFTNPEDVTAALDAGVADLQPLIVSDGILLEGLRYGEIRHPDSPFPLKMITLGEGALGSNFSSMGFLRCYLVGIKLHTISRDNNATPLGGELSLAVPFANGFNDLNLQLQNELIEAIVLQERGKPGEDS